MDQGSLVYVVLGVFVFKRVQGFCIISRLKIFTLVIRSGSVLVLEVILVSESDLKAVWITSKSWRVLSAFLSHFGLFPKGAGCREVANLA